MIPPTNIISIGTSINASHMIYRTKMAGSLSKEIIFECNPDVYNQCLKKSKGNANVLCYLAGLSDQDQKQNFHILSNPKQSTFLGLDEYLNFYPNLKEVESISVEAKRLDTLVKEKSIEIEKIDTLIIDIPGSEVPIISGAESILRYFDNIYTSISFRPIMGANQASIRFLDTYLSKYGFERKTTEIANHPALGEALYIKNEIKWQEILVKTNQQAALKNELKKAKAGNKELANELERANSLLAKEKQSIEKLKVDLNLLNVAKVSVDKQLEKSFNQLKQSQSNLKSCEEKNNCINKQLSTEKQNAAKIAMELNTVNDANSALQSQLDEIKNRIIKQEEQSRLRADDESNIQAVIDEKLQLQKELAEEKNKNEIIAGEVERAQAQLELLMESFEQNQPNLTK